MRPRQVLLASVLLAVVPALVFGSGGFSEVAGERGIDVAVADDESAYLGIEVESVDGYVGGEPLPVLRLTDQHSGDLTLQSVDIGRPLIEVETEMESAPSIGETDPLTVAVRCTEGGEGTVPVTVVADGPGTRISVQRMVPVTCHAPETHRVDVDIDFRGCGTARIEADDAIYPLNVTKVIDNPSADGNATRTETIDSNGRVGPGRGGKLVAIEVDGERYENQCTGGGNEQPVETDGENGRPSDADDE